MNQLSIKEIITSKNPDFLIGFPSIVKNSIYSFLERLLYIRKVNSFIVEHQDKFGLELIDELFESLDISYITTNKDRSKIPSEGKILIVANHPLGGLDGLIILKLISEIRSDVKIVANDLLLNIPNISSFFLPYDLLSGKSLRKNYEGITKSIKNEDAIILFPAGEVARLTLGGIKDNKWKNGAVYFAEKYQVPVLPVYIKGRNSILFYLVSIFSKKLSMFLLPHELFNKKEKVFKIKIGNHISPKAFSTKYQRIDFLTKSLKKHLQLISKGKKGIFETEKNVIPPVFVKDLRKRLFENEYLGDTSDGKNIFVVDYKNGNEVIREISRLREITFRKVGEGTGSKNDSDHFDKYYKHLVLWDDNRLEIVGSYRLAVGKDILDLKGTSGFYTSTLFDYTDEFIKLLPHSIELGRSFVQSKYWNSFALDYLWQGIGRFLQLYPETKYLFGPVSLSNNYSIEAKNLIVYFYTKWFSNRSNLITSKSPYVITDKSIYEMQEIFSLDEYDKEFLILKNRLKILGFTIPTLYRQYADLCLQEGVHFLDFNVDSNFQNCIDALVHVDLSLVKLSKKDRYLTNNFKFTGTNVSMISK